MNPVVRRRVVGLHPATCAPSNTPPDALRRGAQHAASTSSPLIGPLPTGACTTVNLLLLPSSQALLLGWFCASLMACSAQGIPLTPAGGGDTQEPPRGVDQGSLDDSDNPSPPTQACVPEELRCLGDNLLQCNEQGTNYTLTPCPLSTQCLEGRCQQATPSCASTDEPLVLSHQTLFFQPSQDNKTLTSTLSITNCTDSPLTIQKASIQSTQEATSQDARVFDFSQESAPIQGIRLPANATLPVKIEFSPRTPLLYEQGTLYLSFLGASDPILREVALKTNTWCLSIPPLLDLGDLLTDQPFAAEIPLHNCGSRALVLSGSEVSLQTPDENLLDGIAVRGTERPLLIAPGQIVPITLEATPTAQGSLAGQIDLTFSPRDQERLTIQPTSIPFIARTTSVPPAACTDDSQNLAVRLDELPLDAITPHALEPYQLSLIETSSGKQVATFSPDTVRFESSSLIAPRRPPFILSSEKLFSAQALFIPHMAGPHTLRASLHELSPQGDVTCRTTSTDLQIAHFGDYTVELAWYSPEDPVPDDLFPNQGVDLDLFVRYIPDEDGLEPDGWLDAAASCNTRSVAWPSGRCAKDRGYVLQQSMTGAHPEVIALYPDDTSRRVEIGVLVNNMAGFKSACATVRLWKGEELLVEAPGGQLQQDACLGDTLQPSRLLERNNNFLILGTFDLLEQTFDDSMESLFPRGIPR